MKNKNVIWENKHKFWGRPGFSMRAKKPHYHDRLEAEGYSQNGSYTGSEMTIRVEVYKNWITTNPELVTLHATYKGFDYQRNYDKIFSERGIQLICAKFTRDILNKKIK